MGKKITLIKEFLNQLTLIKKKIIKQKTRNINIKMLMLISINIINLYIILPIL